MAAVATGATSSPSLSTLPLVSTTLALAFTLAFGSLTVALSGAVASLSLLLPSDEEEPESSPTECRKEQLFPLAHLPTCSQQEWWKRRILSPEFVNAQFAQIGVPVHNSELRLDSCTTSYGV